MLQVISYVGLLIGVLILTLLILWQGAADIFSLLFSSGFSLLLLPLSWIPSYIIANLSWYLLFPTNRLPPFWELLSAFWMGRAINTLLPVATIGGEIAKVRLLILWGKNGIDASASVMVDKTVQALALVPWAIIGTGLLICLAVDNTLIFFIIPGTLLLTAGIIGFILVQKAGLFGFFSKFVGKFMGSDARERITVNAQDVDSRIKQIYANKKCFFLSVAWRTLSFIVQSAEVWLACYLLNHPISLADALMLKSLTTIITDIAFIIPNGYGVQESSYLVLGPLIGLTPEFSLVVSLATRVRELIIDLPGLFCWQHIEAKYLLDKRK